MIGAPRIGWHNVFLAGTLSAIESFILSPPELAFDGNSTTAFRRTSPGGTHWIQVDLPAPVTVDYAAIAAHNWSSGTVVAQRWRADLQVYFNMHTPITLTDNRPHVWEFAPQEGESFRIRFEGHPGGTLSLGAAHIGKALVPDSGLPLGWEPPSLNERVEYSSPISVGGQLLPRTVRRRGVEVRVPLQAMSYGFARTVWQDFLERAHERAVFMWWSHEGHREIVYGGLEQHGGRFGTPGAVDLDATLVGINR